MSPNQFDASKFSFESRHGRLNYHGTIDCADWKITQKMIDDALQHVTGQTDKHVSFTIKGKDWRADNDTEYQFCPPIAYAMYICWERALDTCLDKADVEKQATADVKEIVNLILKV